MSRLTEQFMLDNRQMYVDYVNELYRFKEWLVTQPELLEELLDELLYKTTFNENSRKYKRVKNLDADSFKDEKTARWFVNELAIETMRTDEGYDAFILAECWGWSMVEPIKLYVHGDKGFKLKNKYPNGTKISLRYAEDVGMKKVEDLLTMSNASFLYAVAW